LYFARPISSFRSAGGGTRRRLGRREAGREGDVTIALLVLWVLGIVAGQHLVFWLHALVVNVAVTAALGALRRRLT
jgi:hypothetical protein